MQKSGNSGRKMAKELNVSRTTITRLLSNNRAAFKPFEISSELA